MNGACSLTRAALAESAEGSGLGREASRCFNESVWMSAASIDAPTHDNGALDIGRKIGSSCCCAGQTPDAVATGNEDVGRETGWSE